MRIVLVRHGRPAYDHASPVPGREFDRWLRGYGLAPLDATLPPPDALREVVRGAAVVATSPLRRSLESAELLAPARSLVTEAEFRESELPGPIPVPLRLNPHLWTRVSRLAWLLGWSARVESLPEVRARAGRATERLVELARDHGSVALVGHGVLNSLIARALRSRGWRGPRTPRAAYWSAATFVAPEGRPARG